MNEYGPEASGPFDEPVRTMGAEVTRELVEHLEAVFYLHDPELDEMIYLSSGYEAVWGRPVEEVYEDPSVWMEALHPEDRERVRREIDEHEGGVHELAYRIVRPDGETRWIWDRMFPMTDESGRTVRLAGLAQDVTGAKRDVDEVERREEWYRALFEDSHDAIVITDWEGRVLEVNHAFEEVSGYDRDELVGSRTVHFYADPDRRAELLAALEERGAVRDFEVRIRRADGEVRECRVTVSVLHAPDGRLRLQSIVRDETERVRQKAELERMALHDWLTGVPNRALFQDRLHQALARAERTGEFLALLYVDLNGFKTVNDRHGHDAGDEVLVETARRLTATVRDPDSVARVGGDEFVVLLAGLPDPAVARKVARRILEAFEAPVAVDATEVAMTVAVGIALVSGEDVPGALSAAETLGDPDLLVRRADQAMYAAKTEPGSAMVAFGPDLESVP